MGKCQMLELERTTASNDRVTRHEGAETMRMLLESSGHEVHVAHSGVEALTVARRIRPEIALLDIGLPDMSGYDWLKRFATRHGART